MCEERKYNFQKAHGSDEKIDSLGKFIRDWNKGLRESAWGASVVYFQGWKDERAGWDGNTMCRILLERCTGPQTENVMRHQRPPGAYQTDDSSLTDVVLALSTEMRPAANASSWGGGQVKKKYLDKSVTVCLMHTKITAERWVLNFLTLACFTRPLAIFVCLLCLILSITTFVLDCTSNFYLPIYLPNACCSVGERL